MVKGTNRQVIVVKSPDPQMFEEAIFVLREDCMGQNGGQQVLEQARRAADEYLRRCGLLKKRGAGKKRARAKKHAGERAWGAIVAASGAAAAGAAWLAASFFL